VVVYDIGASRGHFFKEVCNRFHLPVHIGTPAFKFVAVDKSEHMLASLKLEMPWVQTVNSDACELPDLKEQADIICLFYILQFIEGNDRKVQLLKWAHRNLKDGGVVILGQKDEPSETYLQAFSDEYYRFRVDNGYSLEEIKAKTEALKNSMWPSTPAWLESMCYNAGFRDYIETTRWLQFSTSMCTK
jgi:tRNA (cmo5U34)-methyltransferase